MCFPSYGRLCLLALVTSICVVKTFGAFNQETNTMVTHDACSSPNARNCYPKESRESSHCINTYYKKVKKKKGGSWWRKTKYYYVKKSTKKTECCSGHAGSKCFPTCHGSTSLSSCNRNEGSIRFKDGSRTTCSGGACTDHETCTACNTGYYATSDGWCKACETISNCDIPICSSGGSSTCMRCSGEVICGEPGMGVFLKSNDKESCIRGCSWKSGYRCYPGRCNSDDMLFSSCRCAAGYINDGNCDTFDPNADEVVKPQILELEAFLDKGDGSPRLIIPDPAYKERKLWTNDVVWNDVSIEMQTQYKLAYDPPGDETKTIQPYIVPEHTKIGVKKLTLRSIFRRGTIQSKLERRNTSCNFDTDCSLDVAPISLQSTPWRSYLKNAPFQHADSITFTGYIENGGIVTYNDWDTQNSNDNHVKTVKSYSIKGITVSKAIEVGFDLYKPEHCAELTTPCPDEPLVVEDFFETSTLDVTWKGWKDLDSGLKQYQIDLYPLAVKDAENPILETVHDVPFDTIVDAAEDTARITFGTPGPYYVELNAYDWAGNFKPTRRICLFDDISVVDLIGYKSNVTLATDETVKEWIKKEFTELTLVWPFRFTNTRHHVNGWLNQVASLETVSRDLDDTKGSSLRTTEPYHNILGVVRVDVGYTIDPGFGGSVVTRDFITVPKTDFDAQQLTVYENSVDGNKYMFSTRGYDAIGKYGEDIYSVKVDASPPVFEYLWLTKGDEVNISVHNVTEFNELIIEWEVYDIHSGIYEISWKLFDNYTGDVILHGNAHETPQGGAASLEECNTNYGSYARGPNCYCTPFDGCFHRHYQVKPVITNTGSDGLHEGKHFGIHEGDYFIEVVAINKARLETKIDFQITVDTSPPHTGSVHDGLTDGSEVDFQESLSLRSHWNGFFDKESGVWFYLYKYDTECTPNEDFDLTWAEEHSFTKTYNREGHYEAPEAGTYFVTVAAFNHALDHSLPVCSDGVTVDSTPAEISEVVVRNVVTKPSLFKTADDTVMYLHRDRTTQAMESPSAECIAKAVLLAEGDINMIPQRRDIEGEFTNYVPGTTTCEREETREQELMSFVRSDSYMDISWNVSSTASGIHDFEVGLASQAGTNPDLEDFVSSKQHQRLRLLHPNIWNGEEFYILLKSTTKASMENLQSVGPFVVCKTKPTVTGTVDVQYETDGDHKYLIGSWTPGSFTCDCDPYKLLLEIGIGTDSDHDNVLPFQALSTGGTCTDISTCTAVNVGSLPWNLHGYREYHMIVRLTNIVGNSILVSSEAYIHDVELASQGLVFDVVLDGGNMFDDTEDIDYQTDTTQLTAKWSGFEHPYLSIRYIVCLLEQGVTGHVTCEEVGGTELVHTFTGLTLDKFKTYYHEVIAETSYGNVSAMSDGVTIVEDSGVLSDMVIRDGPPLLARRRREALDSLDSHHNTDSSVPEVDDLEYQRSTSELHAHWDVTEDVKLYTSDTYWAVEERAGVSEHWETVLDYQYHRYTTNISVNNLFLEAGRKYRFSVKFCAGLYCFQPVRSNGVMVIANPPLTGSLKVNFNNVTNVVSVEMERFYDPDIPNFEEAADIMDHYEWTITDNSTHSNIIFKWSRVNVDSNDLTKLWFTETLEDVLFTKCWRLAVRGYTKSGLYSTVSHEIRNCSDIKEVTPALVIDATGTPVESVGVYHKGQTITLGKNQHWAEEDKDYTTYDNVLSAAWPTLRYKKYIWAVIEAVPTDPVLYYHASDLELQDPCSHPDFIQCGETENEYMNAMFEVGTLLHGRRYVVCLHANATVNSFEKWTQELPDINVCSNGITVDFTPPDPNEVWLGNQQGQSYQTTTSDISVNWKPFVDVEEAGSGVYESGIRKYKVAIGSSYNGVDVKDFTDVGVTDHVTFHGLRLQSGHSYFATVMATDFTNQTAQATSPSIKVDVTPPDLTGNSVTLNNRHVTSTTALYACWSGVFIDDESGISHYEWGIGSHPGYDDVYPYTVTTQDCGENDVNHPLSLLEGHSYFVSVKAHNKAGLIRTASSWGLRVEASPPVKANVYDGPKDADGNLNDIDYVRNMSVLEAHWTEFYDHHSTVVEYSVSAGTCRECGDVLQLQSVGMVHDLRVEMVHLVEGMQYFVSVTACNTARLCTTSYSDGFVVDTSPPMAGRILDGIEGRDVQYQSSRLHLGAEWHSFVDAQSGLSHYVWRVGTEMYGDDILTATSVHRMQESFVLDYQSLTGNLLPVGKRLYSTVRAYNKAGMWTESCSNGFRVDDTAPEFVQPLTQSHMGTAVPGTSVLRSVLKVEWEVEDPESYIEEQYLSISSHIGGDFELSSTKVAGIVRDYTFTGLDLHDGSYYDIHLTVCNGAKQCTRSSLTNLLVDSSHPTPGMFGIDTDHAAKLKRQPDGWMKWTTVGLSLAWVGFEDIHSGIDRYMINIGSSLFNNDLSQTPGEPTSIPHTDTDYYFDEGMVQVIDVMTNTPLSSNTKLFVSMWAINKVGLPSPIIHGEFRLVYGSMLSLVRRCDAITCYGHCVCSPHGETCDSDTLCDDVTTDHSNTLVQVQAFLDLTFPSEGEVVVHSPINSMLAAKWSVSMEQGKQPQWYEWSVGESQYDVPKGVYNEAEERVWHDAARNTSWIVTFTDDHLLKDYVEYSFFIRVWYDMNTFSIFKSGSVMIYSTPPLPVTIQSKSVKEVLYGSSGGDLDFFDRDREVFINWDGKFNDYLGSLDKYHVFISSAPGGHDVHELSRDLLPSRVEVNITGLAFDNNTLYYSVVQAYNRAGLHATVTSDGFTLDPLQPHAGVVHDGSGVHDAHAVNSSEILSAFWFGFNDVESGIKNYETCISTRRNSRCDIKTWSSVGIATKSLYVNSKHINDGTVVYHYIRAVDVADHRSDAVRSTGVIIDSSSPVRDYTLQYDANKITNPSFELYDTPTLLDDFNDLSACDAAVESWTLKSPVCVVHVQTLDGIPPDGTTFIVLSGSISQNVGVLPQGKYRLSFFTSHLLSSQHSQLSSTEGYIDFMGKRNVFIMYNKPSLIEETDGNIPVVSWQEHQYYFHVTEQHEEEDLVLTIGTVKDSSHFAIDSVQLEHRVASTDTTDVSVNVQAKPVFTSDWSSLHAEWNFVDEESLITEYLWAIGTVQGGTQLQDFTTVGRQTFAYAYDLRLIHNTVVYVTVVAVNRAGLRTVGYTHPIIIDKTQPVFTSVADGLDPDEDLDVQKVNEISVSWKVEDPESGINQCQWAIGSSPGDTSLQEYKAVPVGERSASVTLSVTPVNTVYTTVKCTNNAALTSMMTTDGVVVKHAPPSVDEVFIDIMGASPTQYVPRDGFHADPTYVKFRWTGFHGDDRIAKYLVSIIGPGLNKEELVQNTTSSFSYVSFTNMTLVDSLYTVSVTAINEVFMYSQMVTKDLILSTQPPQLTGNSIQIIYLPATNLKMLWTGVFTSPYPMYYEVTAKLAGAEGDLIQWQETTNTELEIVLDTSAITGSSQVAHVTVRAISYSGIFVTARAEKDVYFI